jgi:hypothetical protein
MNAPELVPGISRVPRREDYEGVVKGLRPFVCGEELSLRSSLLLMRDRAMATKSRACEPSWHLLDVVERVASENAMNWKVTVDDLREIRRLCLNCVASASSFDALFHPRLPGLEDGEANGRGA